MNVSVIDIGSNTIKATLFKVSENGVKSVLDYKGYKAKLIACVEEHDGKRILSREGRDKLYSALADLIAFSESFDCTHIFAFATASLRNIDNADGIVNDIFDTFGLNIDILSGEEEAMCSLRGLLSDQCTHSVKEGIMIDMGGGSTEIVYFANGKEPEAVSLPFGCLSLYKQFVKSNVPDEGEIMRIEEFVKNELKKCPFAEKAGAPLFLIGGSARAVLKLVRPSKAKQTLGADGRDFTKAIEKMSDCDFFECAEKLIPGRSLTVSPACVAYRVLTHFIRPVSVTVSESGVREGYLEKILP